MSDINPKHKPLPPKLYLLTNDDPVGTLLDKLERAFDTGAIDLLQVRRKHTLQQFNLATLYQETELIVALANEYHIDVVINDDMALASHFGTGVHLGQRYGSIKVAREILGDGVVIGRTCHHDMALFREAKKDGATYGAMGTVFASLTKPQANIVPIENLLKASATGFPLCVIGGITLDNAVQLQKELAGAKLDYIAVTADIMNCPIDSIGLKCQGWRRLLAQWY